MMYQGLEDISEYSSYLRFVRVGLLMFLSWTLKTVRTYGTFLLKCWSPYGIASFNLKLFTGLTLPHIDCIKRDSYILQHVGAVPILKETFYIYSGPVLT